jgi:tetratricopeptide (TPR) repeat protein
MGDLGDSGDIGDSTDTGEDSSPPADEEAGFSLPDDLSGIGDFGETGDMGDLGDSGDIGDSTDTGEDSSPPADEEAGFSLPDDIGSTGIDSTEDSMDSGGDSFELNDEDEFFIDEFSIQDEDAGIDSLSDMYAPKDGEESHDQFDEVLHEDEDISISESQLQKIQKTLNYLPLNLKIKVEELIGLGQAIGDDLRTLLDMLIKGVAPLEIAAFVSQITGEKVILPKRFEKKTGVAFEKERNSFAYALRENIIPILTIFFPSLILLTILTIGGYNLKVWLDAQEQFKRGIYYIKEEKNFALGNDEFSEAYKKAKDDKWYFRYAEAFASEHQYEYAREKYEQLLAMKWEEDSIEYLSNFNKQGIIDYAQFESKIRGNHKKAAVLLDHLLFKEPYDKEGLIAAGDNYLMWAQEDETHYNDASKMYAKYKNKYGDTHDIMFRYLHFFIETDNYDEVIALKDLFQARTKIKVDPEIYAQLAGYLMDYNQITDIRDIITRALEVDWDIPEIHYQLARYLQLMEESAEEQMEALINAKNLYANLPPLDLYGKKLKHYINTYNRLGELYYENGRTGFAERELDEAISLIEDRQDKKILGFDGDIGKVYYNRGNIFFDVKDFDAALYHYEQAERNLYENPEMNYKKGYVHYRDKDYLNAVLEFYKAEKEIRNNPNVLFSIGNALYFRENYFAAQGYYTHLLSLLVKRREKIEYIRPDENPSHRYLLNLMMRTYNNLGVTVKKLSEVSRDEKKESEALVYLTKASEHYDILDRLITNPEDMERDKVTKSLPYLNQRHILHPQPYYSLSIYNTIPLNTQALNIDNLFSTTIEE